MSSGQASEHDLKPSSRAKAASRDPAPIHRRLLDAATQLFARDGLDGVNSNQIARQAHVGVGTFYNHFRDKHEAHQAVVLDTLESLRLAVARSTGQAGHEVVDQVRALVAAVVAFAVENPSRFRVAFGGEVAARRAPRSGSGDSGPRPQVAYSTRVTERRLAELQSAGLVDPGLQPGVAARAFVAMQNGVLCWWLEDPARASQQDVVETLIRLHPAVAGRTR